MCFWIHNNGTLWCLFEKLVASQKLDSLSTKAHLDVFENPHTAHTMERALAHTRAQSRADHGGEAVVRGVRDCGQIVLMTGGSLHTYTCAHLSTLGLSLHNCAHSTLGLLLTFDFYTNPDRPQVSGQDSIAFNLWDTVDAPVKRFNPIPLIQRINVCESRPSCNCAMKINPFDWCKSRKFHSEFFLRRSLTRFDGLIFWKFH